MELLVKLSLARNNMQYFVATYMYLDLPWEKPDTTTLSFLLQLTGYLIWQKLLSFCLKLMILLFVRQFAVGWFPKFATDKWLSSHFFTNYNYIFHKTEVLDSSPKDLYTKTLAAAAVRRFYLRSIKKRPLCFSGTFGAYPRHKRR